MSRETSRRTFLIASSLLLCGPSLAGCGDTTDADTPDAESPERSSTERSDADDPVRTNSFSVLLGGLPLGSVRAIEPAGLEREPGIHARRAHRFGNLSVTVTSEADMTALSAWAESRQPRELCIELRRDSGVLARIFRYADCVPVALRTVDGASQLHVTVSSLAIVTSDADPAGTNHG